VLPMGSLVRRNFHCTMVHARLGASLPDINHVGRMGRTSFALFAPVAAGRADHGSEVPTHHGGFRISSLNTAVWVCHCGDDWRGRFVHPSAVTSGRCCSEGDGQAR
jgi:hypothetical protein